jgi:DNA-binding response OmpR family regulator
VEGPDRGGQHEPGPGGGAPGAAVAREPSIAGRAGTAGLSGKVLIVDDEQSIRLVCRVNLDSAGFETLEAADGAEALAAARTERPDLILLDIMLPTLDGWAVAEELTSDEATREIPIVFLSARSEHADLSRGYELGGVGYITKPFDAAELGEVVAGTLAAVRRGEREALREAWRVDLGED